MISFDPDAFIVLDIDAIDLPIIYYFRKGSRPCAAVGCFGFFARWLSYFHRPLSLVAVA